MYPGRQHSMPPGRRPTSVSPSYMADGDDQSFSSSEDERSSSGKRKKKSLKVLVPKKGVIQVTEEQVTEEQVNEEQALKIALGPNPLASDKVKLEVSEEIESRLTVWMAKGIGENDLDFLLQQYELPSFLRVPKLNPEVIAYLRPNAKDRDMHLAEAQQLLLWAIASLLGNFTVLFDAETKADTDTKQHLISMNIDSVMIQAHAFYEKTQTRRGLILKAVLSTEVREMLSNQTVDEFLFGKDLAEKLKTLKAVSKAAGQFVDSKGENKSSAKDFLSRRASHPYRSRMPWMGQGAQRGRWTFNQQNPFPFSSNQPNQNFARNRRYYNNNSNNSNHSNNSKQKK